MRDDVHPDSPPTEEELRVARRLAEALDSGDGIEAVGAIGVLGAVAGDGVIDEIAVHRLRADLVARASRRRGRSLWRPFAIAAAAAAAVALAATLAARLGNRSAESLLAQREQMARAALSAVTATGGNGLAGVYETRWRYRNDSNLESARYARLTGTGASASGGALAPSSTGGDS